MVLCIDNDKIQILSIGVTQQDGTIKNDNHDTTMATMVLDHKNRGN